MTKYFQDIHKCIRCNHTIGWHFITLSSCTMADCNCIGFAADNLEYVEQEAEKKGL